MAGVVNGGGGKRPGGVVVGVVRGADVGLRNAGTAGVLTAGVVVVGTAAAGVLLVGVAVVVFGSRAISTALTVFGFAGVARSVEPGKTAPLGGDALNFTAPVRVPEPGEAIAVIFVGELFDSMMRIGSSLLARSRGLDDATCDSLLPQVSVERASTGGGVKLPGSIMPRYGS